jgi:hypothetical protein
MPSKTIRSFIQDINNNDSDGGGLWLPNIQRYFVWDEDQMVKLFDSVMRQYPLPSLLIWKTKESLRNRAFIQQYIEPVDVIPLYRPNTSKTKRLVLDGQQRLQTLFIGLKGSIEGKILHFDVLSGLSPDNNGINYKFKFILPEKATWPNIPFQDLIYTKRLPSDIATDLLNKYDVEDLSKQDVKTLTRNIDRARFEFLTNEALIYQEIDSTDEEGSSHSLDDVVEIFIRANDGGTKLSKSDLMFSLMTANWSTADTEMQEFLSEINGVQFDFDRDFVLKASMVMLDQGARYDVKKLRTQEIRDRITQEWTKLTSSISFVRDFLEQKTFIQSDKALPSYLAIIPLIYFYHKFPDKWQLTKGKEAYLLRVLLTSAFSGRPDNLIDKIVNTIKKTEEFNLDQVFSDIREDQRSLELSENHLFEMGYGSRTVHLLFNLWYSRVDYNPAFDGHLPQIDHIFPRSILKRVKVTDEGITKQKYTVNTINQLANCMLLPRDENGAAGKSDIPPNKWFEDKSTEYLELHCIPKNKDLWEIDQFENFIDERKNLIREKFSYLLFKN